MADQTLADLLQGREPLSGVDYAHQEAAADPRQAISNYLIQQQLHRDMMLRGVRPGVNPDFRALGSLRVNQFQEAPMAEKYGGNFGIWDQLRRRFQINREQNHENPYRRR